jgi:hypothetical protein
MMHVRNAALSVLLSVFFLLGISAARTVHADEIQTICGINSPVGWFPQAYLHDVNCPASLNVNAVTIIRYDNLPVGRTLSVCYTSGTLPTGWVITRVYMNPTSCGGNFIQNDSADVSHTSCDLDYQTHDSCYPPPPPTPTGDVSVPATSIVIPYLQTTGSTSVSYTVANWSQGCIWVSTSNGTPQLWWCGGTTSATNTWNNVPKGGTSKFILTTSTTSPGPVLDTVTVTGVAGAQATLHVTPAYDIVTTGATTANVLVTATASPSTAPFGYTWSAPGYPIVDIQGQINGGAWRTPVPVGPSGSNGDNIPLGSVYNFRLIPHGSTSPVLATMTLTGVAAPTPSFSANPAHVVVPVGSSSGTFSYTWSAPGYQSLDISGSVNGGAWTTPFNIPASGSSGDTIPVGSTYVYRFYPHLDTQHIIGTLTITASH